MKDSQALLNKFKESKFLVASRSNGYICPGSMRIVGFEEAIGFGNIINRNWSPSGLWFSSGIYVMEGDGFTNAHRQIRKLFKEGLLEMVDSEQTNYHGYPYKVLRIKENA
jgi:hypothetical protein